MKAASFFLLLVITCAVLSCGSNISIPSNSSQTQSSAELVVTYEGEEVHRRNTAWVTRNELHILLNSSKKKVIIFAAPWCKPCSSLRKIIKKADLKEKVYFVNLDEDWALSLAQSLDIKDVPLMIYINESGEPVAMRKGANKIALYLLVNF